LRNSGIPQSSLPPHVTVISLAAYLVFVCLAVCPLGFFDFVLGS
jgi:hypothetical protein